jgi:uncharacterized protein (DUF885 family)
VRKLAIAVLILVLATFAASCRGRPEAPASASPNAATRALHALFEEEWERTMRESPTWASSLGDRRYDALWPDVSLEAIARREAHERELTARIARIPRADLSEEDALSYDLFQYGTALAVEGQPFALHVFALNQRGGVQTADELADELPFETAKHFADWNARLARFGAYVDQTIELLAEGIRTRRTHARVVMQRVVPQIEAHLVEDPTRSGFYAPYKHMPQTLAAGERTRLEAEARARIGDVVVPAFRRLRAFFVERYLPACKDEAGVWQSPDGAAAYAYLVRAHTTTKLTPDEVHGAGLREVARIRGEMERVRQKLGFEGTLADLFEHLRTDKRFFYDDPASLLIAYRELAKRVDPLLVKLFARLPRTPYGVQAIPDAIAPDTTTAYYREPAADGSRAGTYFVNLYKPEARPIWEMTALTLHESVPGHHLQIALAMENDQIPKFRRHADYTAFIEGWALYAESLGEELGLYDDPYAKLGQLNYEMWRAVRLVVDTGIHHLRWDRQRAIDFFLENAGKAELDVINEVDRYIAWPGQALAYKIGELRIKELRKARQRKLGARFDLREFHDQVLRAGPLPLDVLERDVTALP